MTEIPFKQWRYEEARRLGITEHAVFLRYQRGCYPDLKVRRVNKRVVLVAGAETKPRSARKLPQVCACGRPASRKIGSEWECQRCAGLERGRRIA